MTPSQIAFYATVATVIPVLFLAIAVQGRVVQGLVRTGAGLIVTSSQIEAMAEVIGASDDGPRSRSGKDWVTFLVVVLLQLIAIAILAAGGYGELLAVYALYQGHDQATTRLTVLVATMFLIIFLIITVVAGPFRIVIAWLLRGKSQDLLGSETGQPGKSETGKADNSSENS